jgi:hypothetical protein
MRQRTADEQAYISLRNDPEYRSMQETLHRVMRKTNKLQDEIRKYQEILKSTQLEMECLRGIERQYRKDIQTIYVDTVQRIERSRQESADQWNDVP